MDTPFSNGIQEHHVCYAIRVSRGLRRLSQRSNNRGLLTIRCYYSKSHCCSIALRCGVGRSCCIGRSCIDADSTRESLRNFHSRLWDCRFCFRLPSRGKGASGHVCKAGHCRCQSRRRSGFLVVLVALELGWGGGGGVLKVDQPVRSFVGNVAGRRSMSFSTHGGRLQRHGCSLRATNERLRDIDSKLSHGAGLST